MRLVVEGFYLLLLCLAITMMCFYFAEWMFYSGEFGPLPILIAIVNGIIVFPVLVLFGSGGSLHINIG